MIPLSLRPLEDREVPLVEGWLRRDHVVRWLGDPEPWLEELRGRRGRFSFQSAYFCKARSPGVVLRVQTMEALVPATAFTRLAVAVAIPDR